MFPCFVTYALAVYALVVDAKNERAQAFYERYGFRAFASAPRARLHIPPGLGPSALAAGHEDTGQQCLADAHQIDECGTDLRPGKLLALLEALALA